MFTHRIIRPSVAAFGLSVLATLTACDIDHSKAESLIVTTFKDKGVDAVVSCPSGIKVEEGGTFECKVTVDGVEFTETVKQLDGKGTIEFEDFKNVVFTEGLAAEIKEVIKAAGKGDIDVECKDKYWVFKKGETHECDIKDKPDKVVMTFADDLEKSEWKIVPKEG